MSSNEAEGRDLIHMSSNEAEGQDLVHMSSNEAEGQDLIHMFSNEAEGQDLILFFPIKCVRKLHPSFHPYVHTLLCHYNIAPPSTFPLPLGDITYLRYDVIPWCQNDIHEAGSRGKLHHTLTP